ncbi:GBP5 [Symbiodinium natans]|uniref:GBP5 protein n=1 Tax=Symbiodinium natans TaxID=878477 RepID=A0A812JTS7_9DINO|nr:GBP5 [Symbiodinium natans]
MSLCMQLSSVFLLNTKGVLSESLFSALSLVCNMAEHFEGQEASKPALLWVLRDFLLELVDDGKRLTPDEYLESTLHKKPPDGVDPQRSQAAREVRETLLRFFPQRQCATLCQPAIDEQQLRELPEVPFERLRLEFRNAFQELQAKLLSLTDTPKTIGGQALCAAQWIEMLRRLVQSLNDGHAMRVGDAWAQVQHTNCGDLVAELRERAASELQKVRQGSPFPISGGRPLPISDTALAASLKECRRAVREEFRSRAVGDESMKASYWKELKAALQDDEQTLRQHNVEMAEAHLRQAGAEWSAWLSQEEEAAPGDPKSEALLHALGLDLPAQPVASAAWEALSSARMARLKWDGTREAAKAQLKLVTEELERKAVLAAAASKQAEGEQLEKSREVGQLHGQVEALQQQAREFIERERALKEQVLLAEEELRREQHARSEADRLSEQRIHELQSQIAELRSEALQLQECYKEKRQETAASPRDTRPKCTCSVM